MGRSGHIPVRTCIACREKRGKHALIRLTLAGRRVVPDPAGTGRGRGAYVCPDETCTAAIKNTGLLRRAFRTDIGLSLDAQRLLDATRSNRGSRQGERR